MAKPIRIPNAVADRQQGTPGEKRSAASQIASLQSVPSGLQLPFVWDKALQFNNDVNAIRALVRAMIERAGGLYALAAGLGKPLSYASKISEAVNGMGGKHVQAEWIAWLLANSVEAVDVWMAWHADRYGFEPPVRRAEPTDLDELAAFRAVAADMGPLGEDLRARVNAKMGRGK